MNLSRRDLYAAGEPFGDCATERKPGGGYLCGGGGKSVSSANPVTNNTDKRLAVGDGGFGVSADDSVLSFSDARTTTINSLDGGAITGAFDATKRALQSIDSTVAGALTSNTEALRMANATNADGFDKLLSVAEGLFTRGESLIGQTQQAVADAYTQAQTTKAGTIDNRTIIVLSVVGAAAFIALKRK